MTREEVATNETGAVQCLLLQVRTTVYALDIYRVDEVVRMAALTSKPDMPAWLAGYLNLRGDVLPVVDLRTRLDGEASPLEVDDLIVIVQHAGRRAGLIVDNVNDVVLLPLPNQDTQVTRHGRTLVFWLDPILFIEEAYAV